MHILSRLAYSCWLKHNIFFFPVSSETQKVKVSPLPAHPFVFPLGGMKKKTTSSYVRSENLTNSRALRAGQKKKAAAAVVVVVLPPLFFRHSATTFSLSHLR